MKKHIRSLFLVGMIFSASYTTTFDDKDYGKFYTPKDTVEFATNLISGALTQLATHYIAIMIPDALTSIKDATYDFALRNIPILQPKIQAVDKKELEQYKNTPLTHDIAMMFQDDSDNSTGEHKIINLHGPTGTGKTFTAYQIASRNDGDFYTLHNDDISRYASPLQADLLLMHIQQISDQTPEGKIATLLIDEFGAVFNDSITDATHQAKHGQYIDTWKQFADNVKKFSKVQVVTTSNTTKINSAIASRINSKDMANPYPIRDTSSQTSQEQRTNYFKGGFQSHLSEQNRLTSQLVTKASKNDQDQRDQILKDRYHVTDTMIEATRDSHEKEIKRLKTPWNLALYLQPWLWQTVTENNRKAEQLKKNGYFTDVVTTLHFGKKTPHAAAQQYAEATEGINYRDHDAIVEIAKRDKLKQIERMFARNKANNTFYQIDPATRTWTVVQEDYIPKASESNNSLSNSNVSSCSSSDSNNGNKQTVTIKYKYGVIEPRHLLLAAQRKENEDRKNGVKKFVMKDSTTEFSPHLQKWAKSQTPAEEFEAFSKLPLQDKKLVDNDLLPTRDLEGLARRAICNPEKRKAANRAAALAMAQKTKAKCNNPSDYLKSK